VPVAQASALNRLHCTEREQRGPSCDVYYLPQKC